MAPRKDENQNSQASGRAFQKHPLFSGQTSIGIISGENPRFAAQLSGHEVLGQHLQQMGLRAEPRQGRYGHPEKSWMVYGPTREQMFELGRRFGQESVVYGQGGKHELLYTNGPNAGRYHPSLGHEWFDKEPEDYYTHMPELGGYLRLIFDWDTLHPSNLAQPEAIAAQQVRATHGAPPTSAQPKDSPLKKAVKPSAINSMSLTSALKPVMQAIRPVPIVPPIQPTPIMPTIRPARPSLIRPAKLIIPFLKKDEIRPARAAPHPHAYDWHDGHTDHHLYHAAPGVVLYSRNQQLAKAVPAHPHMDGSKPPEAQSLGMTPDHLKSHPTNDQVAGVGVSTYAKYALPFGTIDKQHPADLFHYPYHGKNQEIDRLVKDHRYSVYYAGGKYGKPDLANRNYNTKHLMIYDPSPDSGASFGVEQYTDAWRKIHELAHALTYPELNQIYGEGRRIGKLGTHRTLREALRAVHWEWLAAHKQRELSEQIGVNIPDHVFNKELNTVMHDAVHRAVTGKFTEPSGEGFRPHEHKVPLETALGMVREAARNLGIGMHDLVKKSEDSMADDKEYEEHEWRMVLAKGIQERVAAYTKSLLELRQRELKKHLDPVLVGPAPQMMPVDVCPLCGQEDLPGKCKCLAGLSDKSASAKPSVLGMAKAEMCKAHGRKGCVEKNCGSPIMDKPRKKKLRADNAASKKDDVPSKPDNGVAKKELSAKAKEPSVKAKEPIKPAKGNGVKIRALKLLKGPDLWAGEGIPERGEGMAPKPKQKFGLAQLAAGKAKLLAAGVKPMSPLAAPKPGVPTGLAKQAIPSTAPKTAPKPGVSGLKSPPAAAGAAPKPAAPKSSTAPKPAAPAAAAPKPPVAKLALEKSEGEITDLKKALGQCALCKNPEHIGQCPET